MVKPARSSAPAPNLQRSASVPIVDNVDLAAFALTGHRLAVQHPFMLSCAGEMVNERVAQSSAGIVVSRLH